MNMRTMHSVVKRGALYWDRTLLPPQGYEARIARLQAQIAAAGDDAWLMMGDVERHGPVVYATNFMPRVRSALALVPRQGAPVLLANISTRDIPAARTITFVEDIRAFGKISKDLLALMAERFPSAARIGLCGVSAAMPQVFTVYVPGIGAMNLKKFALRMVKPHEGAVKSAAAVWFIASALAPTSATGLVDAHGS